MATAAALLLAAALVQESAPRSAARRVTLEDVPPAARTLLGERARSAGAFDDYVAELVRETAARQQDGEWDHLVHYLLQSRRFTELPGVEPALSAREYVEALEPGERAAYLADGRPPSVAKVPALVRRRVAALLAAVERRPGDARLAWFRPLVESTPAHQRTDRVLAEYARAMRFLYRKEFASPAAGDAQALLEYVAGLYRERGHSTDSQVESGFAVQQALAVIRAEADHGPLDRVLIVGPGLDFAPRTDLVDLFEPRSYQPFAVGDALLGLRLASSERLRIHCVDISPRVVAYLAGLPKDAPTALPLVSGLAERADRPFSADYREYFAGLGKSVGKERPLVLPAGFEGRLSKRLEVRREFAERLTAERLDVVTERHDPPPVYDLVVVTNVFSYFDPPQQALALANVASTLRKGGYLVHNEPQSALVAAAEALGLSLVQARSVLLASHPREPFFDRVVIHRRTR